MASLQDFEAAGLRRISNPHCSGSAMDLGATVISWQPNGHDEVLFCSRDAAVGPDLEIHGGIPICAPWFGGGRDDVMVPRKHGLVRWAPWRLVEEHSDAAGTHLAWELTSAEVAHLPGAADYPSDLTYRHEVTFGRELHLDFTVHSPTKGFVLDAAFHSYFLLPEAADTRIVGLEGAEYRDHSFDPPRWLTEQEPFHPTGLLDRVYRHGGRVRIESPGRTITLSPTGSANYVVWNPGEQVPADFAADEAARMICVETGVVQADHVSIPAGGSHTMGLTLAVTA